MCRGCQNEKNTISETWLRNRTELNHDEMRRAKIKCNKVIAQAKTNIKINGKITYCTKEVTNCKDLGKVKKVKNGIQLPQCPVT